MLHDNTRWSRVSEQNSADGVLQRHRELPVLQLHRKRGCIGGRRPKLQTCLTGGNCFDGIP